jgi:Tol biopolymer transport system component
MAAIAPFGMLRRHIGGGLSRAAAAAAGVIVIAALATLGFLGFMVTTSGSAPATQLAYLDAGGALWLVDPDGSDPRRLADDGACGDFPRLAWSPDGGALACISRDRIVLRDAEGAVINDFAVPIVGDPEKTGGGLVDFLWAPDSENFAYLRHSENGFALAVADRFGRQQHDIGPVDSSSFAFSLARHGSHWWSPDGSLLVFMRTDSTRPEFLLVGADAEPAPGPAPDFSHPLGWALGGEALIVALDYQPPPPPGDAYPSYEASLVDLESGDRTHLPQLDNGVQFWPSPGGTMVAYLERGRRHDGLPSLSLLDLRSGQATSIADSVIAFGRESIPQNAVRFSNDGAYLSWTSADFQELYRAGTNGSPPEKLVEVPGGFIEPSPDFAHVAYTTFDAEQDRIPLYVARSDGSDPIELTSRPFGGGGSPYPVAWRTVD